MDKRFDQNTIILPLNSMRKFAYKKIFEGLPYLEEKTFEHSINWWIKSKRMNRTQRGNLKAVVTLMIMNEEGKMNEMKEKVKRLGLNYKSMYGV